MDTAGAYMALKAVQKIEGSADEPHRIHNVSYRTPTVVALSCQRVSDYFEFQTGRSELYVTMVGCCDLSNPGHPSSKGHLAAIRVAESCSGSNHCRCHLWSPRPTSKNPAARGDSSVRG